MKHSILYKEYSQFSNMKYQNFLVPSDFPPQQRQRQPINFSQKPYRTGTKLAYLTLGPVRAFPEKLIN